MRTINVHEAKSTLSTLLVQVEQGEEVVIARNCRPVAKLTRIAPPSHREPGSWQTLPGWEAFRYDPAVLAPLTDAELRRMTPVGIAAMQGDVSISAITVWDLARKSALGKLPPLPGAPGLFSDYLTSQGFAPLP